jgi:hypothetical protein
VNTRRLLTVGAASLALLVFVAPAAIAADLSDYLAGAAEASYGGDQATWCSFEGQTEFSVVSIEQAGSTIVVESGGSSEVFGNGKVAGVGSTSNGVALANWSSVPLADRYVTTSVEPQSRLGRDVSVVTVEESGAVRARVWFDKDTGATLGSEVYDGNGDLFRLSWLLDFNPNPRRVYTVLGASAYDLVVSTDAADMPKSVAGYTLVDTYRGPNDSIHAFYSDGLFSFSVFRLDGEGASGPFIDAKTMAQNSGNYRWILTASELWVQWSGSGQTYVLVGDLPPDHLQEVLGELPAPSGAGLLSRIWNGIFG